MKILSFGGQAYIFLLTALAGAVIGFVFDIFRAARRIIPHASVFVQIEDILYWLLAVLFLFNASILINSGQIRAFNIIAAASGAFVYFSLFSGIFLKYTENIKKCLHYCKKCVKMGFRKVTTIISPGGNNVDEKMDI